VGTSTVLPEAPLEDVITTSGLIVSSPKSPVNGGDVPTEAADVSNAFSIGVDPEGDIVVEPIVIPPSPVISNVVITNVDESVHSPE